LEQKAEQLTYQYRRKCAVASLMNRQLSLLVGSLRAALKIIGALDQ
jgi:hypothetical protein